MEVDNTNLEQQEDSSQPSKKVRLFSAKEFRKRLLSSEKLSALQHFSELCDDSENHNYVLEYLENGGTCLELFQLLETSSEVPASLVVKIAHYVLLQIVSNYPQFHSSTYESCRYFLSTHLALVNKMLSLASKKEERKVVLKLLTVIVTFSRKLAKEVLLHVSFNPTNLEMLTKPTGEKDSVRNAFIYFLVAFLVEGEYHTISVLLEKKELLTSVISGLRYDPADIVSLFMLTLKSNILENTFVSKTLKMSIFNTSVVKGIVNLYNWKGPQGFTSEKQLQTVVVDEHDKARVNESVHSFLLVLCASPKFGVIFRDHQLGLGKKTHNSLMYTVLDSLERPWEHSYAGELVTKICGACPDLVKTMWSNLKTYLEPRVTTRWLSAVKFAVVLVKELGPAGIEFCARELSVYQLAQVIQILVAPAPILKTIIPENHIFEEPCIKHNVLCVLAEFLKSIQKFLSASENWLKPQDVRTLKNLLCEHVARNLPNSQSILKDWTKSDNQLGPYSVLTHLEIIFELLNLYESMCPQLLESLSSIDLQSFLNEIQELPEETAFLQIHAIKLFINFEPSIFAPKGDLFTITFPLVLGFYFETKDLNAKTTLNLLLKNTGIFEGSLEEIDLWINGILGLSSFDISAGQSIVEIVKQTSENIFEYLAQMAKFFENPESQIEQQNFQDILENLSGDSLQNSVGFYVKHRSLSPLLLGTLEYLFGTTESKHLKKYFDTVLVNLLHLQTSPSFIAAIITNEKYQGLMSKHVVSYAKSWGVDANPVVLSKTKVDLAKNLSSSFLEGDVDEFFTNHQEEIVSQPGQAQNCLNQALFYFCNLNKENLSANHLNNCKKVVKFLMAKQKPQELVGKIFGHPVLLQNFSPLHLDKSSSRGYSTVLLIDVIKEFQSTELKEVLEARLKPFREKLVASVIKVFKKSKSGKKSLKFTHLLEILEIFSLEQQQCLDILNFCSTSISLKGLDSDCLSFYYNLVVFTLKTFMNQLIELEPLNNRVVIAIAQLLTFLNQNPEQFDTSSCASLLKTYLELFPHNLKTISSNLFKSILTKGEFCKENALLAGFLLSKRNDCLNLFVQNLPNVAGKKGLMLSLLQAAISIKASNKTLKVAYENFEPSILKGLQKPQKAGQYFETYPDVLALLVEKFMPEEVCRTYVEKVQKFEVSEPFHVQMLISIFNKIIFNSKAEVSENHLNNAILTLVHATNSLFKKKSKLEDDLTKLKEIATLSNNFFEKIISNNVVTKISFRSLCENDGFQLFCKFCLKFGLPTNVEFLKVLKSIVQFVNFEENEAKFILEMAGSHSEFLEVILREDCDCKTELLDLVLMLCQRWPSLMQRSHVPVLLSAYRATIRPADRIILILLQMYEKAANKTNFYDFKPFLWGTAAAKHYSVRQDIQKALWRQPKMTDILDILQDEWIVNTINNYPLDLGLIATKSISQQQNIYDLAFLLPLFSSLLASENQVKTYKFAKSGALSLTVVALSSGNKELRLAACHVLARLHYHVEASQGGKHKLLLLRFVEALCRGTAVLKDIKLNNFSAIFWAKMALILTNPLHPLYVPLSQYLGAKIAPDLSGVPELYTFLHGSDVNFTETRLFILEILRDGLRTDNDFSVALHAMAFKLIMELFSSCVVDLDTKILVLGVIERACRLDLGRESLYSNFGLLSWLYEVVQNVSRTEENILHSVIQILSSITSNVKFLTLVSCKCVSSIVTSVIDKGLISNLRKHDLKSLLQVILNIFETDNKFINEERLRTIVTVSNNKKCEYLVKYGCKFSVPVRNCVEVEDFVQVIVTKWSKIK